MRVKSENLEKAIGLFEFVIASPDQVGDVELFRDDLEKCVLLLDSRELVELGTHVLPLVLKDGGNIVSLLINSLKNRSV